MCVVREWGIEAGAAPRGLVGVVMRGVFPYHKVL